MITMKVYMLISCSTVLIIIALAMKIVSISFSFSQLTSNWNTFISWLTPPYLYLILNGIIIGIAASSHFHRDGADEPFQLVDADDHTEHSVRQKMIEYSPKYGVSEQTRIYEHRVQTNMDEEVIKPMVFSGSPVIEADLAVPEAEYEDNDYHKVVISNSTWTPLEKIIEPSDQILLPEEVWGKGPVLMKRGRFVLATSAYCIFPNCHKIVMRNLSPPSSPILSDHLLELSKTTRFAVSKKALINILMEVKLWNDKREREMYENFAELYAIIKATEKLEKAYVRDVISSSEYETECIKLIAHFKTLASTLKDTIPSIERFADTYKMDCPAAINRLVTSGVPATIEHRAAAAASSTTSAAAVAECTQDFINAMDTLKLKMYAVDELHPVLSNLSSSLNKLSFLPLDFVGKVKLKEWIARLSKMGAADELTEQQARQLIFDLESSYNSFMAALPSTGT